MPLTRYQLRNEYSLAEPELYRAAIKDDPEALLEGVAMAGLVGVLRQLGDLAEFAAEIFHDLHEEVIATSERGHGLMARVKQLEADVPSLEKTLLSQTNHAPFFTNPGVDWHPKLQTKHNLVTSGDMPRCVMDSYEECRAPPRLFLLDKFDVAGAGACLKRYTDPSFFKAESALSGVATMDFQREKKTRKGKKKGSRWSNGETPEVVSASRSKLHQLLLEERIESAYSDPARRVKLKRRLLNASPLDPKSGKSFMEKFLESPSPEHKMVYETSVTPPSLKLAPGHSSESGLQIVEIRTVSPVKRASRGEERISSSPNAEELTVKPYMEKMNGDVTSKGEFPRVHHHILRGKKEDADRFDGLTSDVDNYMDALTTMGSEIETDTEFRPNNNLGFLSVEKIGTDFHANEEQLEVEAHSSDCRSVGVSFSSDDENRSLNRGRSSYSFSDTVSNPAENALVDTRGSPVLVSSVERGYGEMLSNNGRHDFESSNTDNNEISPLDSLEAVLVNPDDRLDDTSFTASEQNPVDGLNSGNGNASSNGLLHTSNISENASGKEINSYSLDEDIQTDYSPTHSFDEKQVLLHDLPQVIADMRETEASCSEKKSDFDEVSEAAKTLEIWGKTHEVDTVERCASPLYLDSDIESETATETVLAEGIAISAADVRASPGSDDAVGQAPSQEDPEIDEVLNEEYDAESVTKNERNKEDVALAYNKITSRQRESVAQNERNQAEGGHRNSDGTLSYNYSEAEDVILDSSAAENIKTSLNVGDETVPEVPLGLIEQENESHLEKNSEGVVFSSTCNLSEPGIHLGQSVDLQNEPIRENIQLQEADLSPSHPLFRHKESQVDQESCGHASTVHFGEDSPSQPSTIELLPRLAMRDLESNEQEMNLIASTFGQLPEATEINIEEPPPLPPLPPMQWRIGKVQHNSVASPRALAGLGSSPVTPQYPSEQKSQFGLSTFQGGFLQSGSPFSNFAFVEEEKYHHLSEQLGANQVQPTPFSTSLPAMFNHMDSQHWGISLDRTRSMNQFLTLPAVQNERPEYSSFATEGQPNDLLLSAPAIECKTHGVDPVYSSEMPIQPQNQFELVASSEKEIDQDSLNSYGEHDCPADLAVPPTETHDWVEEDEQPSENFMEEQKPKNAEEQPQHGLVATEGEMEQTSNAFAPPGLLVSEGAWSSDTSSLKKPAEVGKENGNASVKNPRPRNPLFDAAAALDKSKLRKVTERVLPQNAPKVEERDSLLEQIRTKSFNLRRAAVTRPNFQGPQTNLKVAAILEKANAIRQACAGSDEDEEDSWSDS